jgi:hypothetical protein
MLESLEALEVALELKQFLLKQAAPEHQDKAITAAMGRE